MNDIADRHPRGEKPLAKFAFKDFSVPTALRDSWDVYEIVHEPIEGHRIATIGFRRATKMSADWQTRGPISLQAARESVAFRFTSEIARSRKEIIGIAEEIKRADAQWRMRKFALGDDLRDGWELSYGNWWVLYCVNDQLILMTFLPIPYLGPVVEFREMNGDEIAKLSGRRPR